MATAFPIILSLFANRNRRPAPAFSPAPVASRELSNSELAELHLFEARAAALLDRSKRMAGLHCTAAHWQSLIDEVDDVLHRPLCALWLSTRETAAGASIENASNELADLCRRGRAFAALDPRLRADQELAATVLDQVLSDLTKARCANRRVRAT